MNNKIEKVSMDELAYYCFWCDGQQLNKDIYNTKDKHYLSEKFQQFSFSFNNWLFNLDKKNRQKLAVAIREFYERSEF
tara:strand:- start:148 stop:381 length:234 start_codon:yes stop_codon:yes gene_type:complete